MPQRYYSEDPQAVLLRLGAVLPPVALERYYRWAPRYYRLDQTILKRIGNETSIEAGRLRGCEKDVYVLIPP